MTKKDIEAIEHAKAIREYCHECNDCHSCVFRTGNISGNFIEDTCMFEDDSIPEDWELPIVKTYKQDFLEKFPRANFETSNLCRKMIYGEEHDCSRMTCEECWNEAYITDRTEERSK